MGLLTIIRKARLKERQVRVLMLGLDNAGKTTICKALLDEDVDQVSPTLGFNIRTIVHNGYTLNVWDIGGQTSLRPYWRNYFEQTDAVIWVVDSSDRARMADCKRELHGLLQEERLMGASLLVFANKQDIRGAMTSDEIEQALDLPTLSSSHRWSIQPCSARFVAHPSNDSSSSPLTRPPADAPAPDTPARAKPLLSVSHQSADPRILAGLDWVTTEVGSRVYYGTQNQLNLPADIKPAGVPVAS